MINAAQIKEHMVVKAADGQIVGRVDHMEGAGSIKLTKNNSPDGRHHFVPLDWVQSVDDQVHLNKASNEVKSEWS